VPDRLLGNSLSDETMELLARSKGLVDDNAPLEPTARLWSPKSGWSSFSPSQLIGYAKSRFEIEEVEDLDKAIYLLVNDPDRRIVLTGRAWHMKPETFTARSESVFRVRVRDRDVYSDWDVFTMVPKAPSSAMVGEDGTTPRIPLAMTASGAMASMVIHQKLDEGVYTEMAIEVFSNNDPIMALVPSVFEVPDAWATLEVWSLDPVELIPYWRIEESTAVLGIQETDRAERSFRSMEAHGTEGVMLRSRRALSDYLRTLD